MPSNSAKQKKQLIFLVVLTAILAAFVAYQFKDKINLPTKARMQNLAKKLEEEKINLQIAEQDKAEFDRQLEELRELAEPFWDASNQRAIEQEVRLRFETLVREAKITWKSISTQRSKSNLRNSIQEIEVKMEFDSITMQDLAMLFEKLDDFTRRNKRQFHWSNFRLSTTPVRQIRAPGQPVQPQTQARTLKLVATAKAYALTPEASDIIFATGASNTTAKGAAKQ